MGGIFWSQVIDWEIIPIGFSIGVLISVLATALYATAARDAIAAKGAPPAEPEATWRLSGLRDCREHGAGPAPTFNLTLNVFRRSI